MRVESERVCAGEPKRQREHWERCQCPRGQGASPRQGCQGRREGNSQI